MNWKYVKRGLLILLLFLLLIPTYRYFGSIDWSKKHSAKIATLPILTETDDTGSFRLPVGDFTYFARAAGLQNEGPAVILLHGFPESSIMWNDLLAKASEEGFRVIAFDQRGYSPGARPTGIEHYHIDELTQDVLAVANNLGFDTFHLVGHDWGAVVAWNVAMEHDERIHSLTTLSIPHIGVFFDAVQNHPEQQQRSGYIKRLQTPFFPEYTFLAKQQAFIKQMMAKNRQEQREEYLGLQAEYGAVTAMINWYRALDLEEITANKTYAKKVHSPTLFIWGTEDMVIAPDIIPEQKSWITAPYREIELKTGHGLIQTKPDTVISEIIAHVKENDGL